MRFRGRSVIVTGAATGIGRASAELFASEGASVLAVDKINDLDQRFSHEKAVTTLIADAGREADVAEMVATAMQRHGHIDIVCANAGISGGMAGIFDQSADDWATLLQVNLIGTFLAIKHGARAMIAAGSPGAIICTASVAGLRAGAGGAAYSASKAGVINLVQTSAQQLTGTGIRVNAVCPGLIETGMTQALYDSARAKGRANMIGQLNPLRRGGEAREIAHVIAFLAAHEASYVNGQAIVVDGGLSSSLPFAKPRVLGEATF